MAQKMTPKIAAELLSNAVLFYVQQNYEVAAKLYELNHHELYENAYIHKQEYNQALEMAKEALGGWVQVTMDLGV